MITPSIRTPAVMYFPSATCSFRVRATIVTFFRQSDYRWRKVPVRMCPVYVEGRSPVAIRMTFTALPITSAGRFSPLGPLGIKLPPV